MFLNMIRKTFTVVGVVEEEEAGEFKMNTYQALDYYTGCICLTVSFHHSMISEINQHSFDSYH